MSTTTTNNRRSSRAVPMTGSGGNSSSNSKGNSGNSTATTSAATSASTKRALASNTAVVQPASAAQVRPAATQVQPQPHAKQHATIAVQQQQQHLLQETASTSRAPSATPSIPRSLSPSRRSSASFSRSPSARRRYSKANTTTVLTNNTHPPIYSGANMLDRFTAEDDAVTPPEYVMDAGRGRVVSPTQGLRHGAWLAGRRVSAHPTNGAATGAYVHATGNAHGVAATSTGHAHGNAHGAVTGAYAHGNAHGVSATGNGHGVSATVNAHGVTAAGYGGVSVNGASTTGHGTTVHAGMTNHVGAASVSPAALAAALLRGTAGANASSTTGPGNGAASAARGDAATVGTSSQTPSSLSYNSNGGNGGNTNNGGNGNINAGQLRKVTEGYTVYVSLSKPADNFIIVAPRHVAVRGNHGGNGSASASMFIDGAFPTADGSEQRPMTGARPRTGGIRIGEQQQQQSQLLQPQQQREHTPRQQLYFNLDGTGRSAMHASGHAIDNDNNHAHKRVDNKYARPNSGHYMEDTLMSRIRRTSNTSITTDANYLSLSPPRPPRPPLHFNKWTPSASAMTSGSSKAHRAAAMKTMMLLSGARDQQGREIDRSGVYIQAEAGLVRATEEEVRRLMHQGRLGGGGTAMAL